MNCPTCQNMLPPGRLACAGCGHTRAAGCVPSSSSHALRGEQPLSYPARLLEPLPGQVEYCSQPPRPAPRQRRWRAVAIDLGLTAGAVLVFLGILGAAAVPLLQSAPGLLALGVASLLLFAFYEALHSLTGVPTAGTHWARLAGRPGQPPHQHSPGAGGVLGLFSAHPGRHWLQRRPGAPSYPF